MRGAVRAVTAPSTAGSRSGRESPAGVSSSFMTGSGGIRNLSLPALTECQQLRAHTQNGKHCEVRGSFRERTEVYMKTINRVRGSAGPPTFPVSLCVPRALRHGGKPANSPWLRIGPNVRGRAWPDGGGCKVITHPPERGDVSPAHPGSVPTRISSPTTGGRARPSRP